MKKKEERNKNKKKPGRNTWPATLSETLSLTKGRFRNHFIHISPWVSSSGCAHVSMSERYSCLAVSRRRE